MTTTVHAYAVREPRGKLEPLEFQLGPLGPDEVEIDVESCGVCFSDVSMIDDAWGLASYPLVPGHEIIGRVRALGERVTHLVVDDVVGVGWHAGYCMACQACMSGDHNLCASAEGTVIGRPGGYADIVRARGAAVFKLPVGVDPRTAGPLLCGGITVFSPFARLGIAPTASVGVIGIGGLGHLALEFARAWGCHVTAFTSTEGKRQEALEMGAHEVLSSREFDATRRFDLLLSTVDVSLDWDAYLGALKPNGRLQVLGAVAEPLRISQSALMMTQRSVSSSPVGSPADVTKMLEFVARHGIAPKTEHFSFDQVNEAIARLRSGQARYRIVLEP